MRHVHSKCMELGWPLEVLSKISPGPDLGFGQMNRNLARILWVDAKGRLQRECSQQTPSVYLFPTRIWPWPLWGFWATWVGVRGLLAERWVEGSTVPPLYLPAEPLSSLSLSQLMWLLLKSFVAKLCLWPCGCLSLTHTLFKYMHLCGVCISVCISMFLYVCVYELCFCVYLYFVCACIYGYLYECPYLSIRYVFLWVFICECV